MRRVRELAAVALDRALGDVAVALHAERGVHLGLLVVTRHAARRAELHHLAGRALRVRAVALGACESRAHEMGSMRERATRELSALALDARVTGQALARGATTDHGPRPREGTETL